MLTSILACHHRRLIGRKSDDLSTNHFHSKFMLGPNPFHSNWRMKAALQQPADWRVARLLSLLGCLGPSLPFVLSAFALPSLYGG